MSRQFTEEEITFYRRERKLRRVGKDMEQLERLYTAGVSLKWYTHCGKQLGTVLLKLYRSILLTQNFLPKYIIKTNLNM